MARSAEDRTFFERDRDQCPDRYGSNTKANVDWLEVVVFRDQCSKQLPS